MPERRVGEIPEPGVRRGLGACLSRLDSFPTDCGAIGNRDFHQLIGYGRANRTCTVLVIKMSGKPTPPAGSASPRSRRTLPVPSALSLEPRGRARRGKLPSLIQNCTLEQ